MFDLALNLTIAQATSGNFSAWVEQRISPLAIVCNDKGTSAICYFPYGNDAELDGLADADGEVDPDGLCEALADLEALALGDWDPDGLTEAETDFEALPDGEIEADALGELLPDGESEAELLALAEAEALFEAEADGLSEADGEIEVDALGESDFEALALAEAEALLEADADGETDLEALLEADADGEVLGLADALTELEADTVGLGEPEGDCEAEALADGLCDGDGDVDAEDEAPVVPSNDQIALVLFPILIYPLRPEVLVKSKKIAPCLNPDVPVGKVLPSASKIRSLEKCTEVFWADWTFVVSHLNTRLVRYGAKAVRKLVSVVVRSVLEIASTRASSFLVFKSRSSLIKNLAIKKA